MDTNCTYPKHFENDLEIRAYRARKTLNGRKVYTKRNDSMQCIIPYNMNPSTTFGIFTKEYIFSLLAI